jgi:succinate dehydrogenase/fumarate reductase cytochrome b subunit
MVAIVFYHCIRGVWHMLVSHGLGMREQVNKMFLSLIYTPVLSPIFISIPLPFHYLCTLIPLYPLLFISEPSSS